MPSINLTIQDLKDILEGLQSKNYTDPQFTLSITETKDQIVARDTNWQLIRLINKPKPFSKTS